MDTKCCILIGSSRKDGNTAALLKPFTDELTKNNLDYELIWLADKVLNPCNACRICQKDWGIFGCHYRDDGQEIFDKIIDCNFLILATPIYSWYCTPPLKVLLDRLVYGMNKYYGETKGPALWAGKQVALITTCGYRPEKGADLWEEGMKRYCKHSKLKYRGMLVEQHLGYRHEFMSPEKSEHARTFARKLIGNSFD